MLHLLIAIDLEVRYWKWRKADYIVNRLAELNPHDMRHLFTTIYRLFPSKILFEYEAQEFDREWANRKVEA